MNDLRDKVTEGTSALFLLTGNVTVDKLRDAFAPEELGELIHSSLWTEQEVKLREDFGAEF